VWRTVEDTNGAAEAAQRNEVGGLEIYRGAVRKAVGGKIIRHETTGRGKKRIPHGPEQALDGLTAIGGGRKTTPAPTYVKQPWLALCSYRCFRQETRRTTRPNSS